MNNLRITLRRLAAFIVCRFTNKQEKPYSPNQICACVLCSAALFVLFAGSSLKGNAAKITAPRARGVVTEAADALSAIGTACGTDAILPSIREKFIRAAGLSDNVLWDTRFYGIQTRNAAAENPLSSDALDAPAAEESAADRIAPLTDADGARTALPPRSKPHLAAASYMRVRLRDGTEKLVRCLSENKIEFFSRDNPLKLLIFGDSQITGIGAGFERIVGAHSAISVAAISVVSSGFIRDDYYNWQAKLADLFSKEQFDAVIFMLGMNDNIPFAKSGRTVQRRTEEWRSVYEPRCRELLDIVASAVPRVYWLKMPLPRSEAYDENLLFIDGIHDDVARLYPEDVVVRVSVRDIFPGADAPYTEKITLEDGRSLRVMDSDGLHYTIPGAQWIMLPLFSRILDDFYFPEPPQPHLP
ncbi:MAG: DUF459 domain-containing protein [Bacteroides sp.]|nr:DUF459 domain-containing protein [Prevotella sp.]MCM1408369.1 DUF459 domain-containing protein [Treponema brennaborense]MCM1470400.1 DUF459 domain-containing protein [Bacteroides sp.]